MAELSDITDYLAKIKASKSPLAFMEGGLYKGNLKPDEPIKPLLDYVTFSFGYTALNELQRLYNGKSIIEDGEFALKVMQYLNDYVAKITSDGKRDPYVSANFRYMKNVVFRGKLSMIIR